VFIQITVSAGVASRLLSLRNRPFTLAYGVIVMLGLPIPPWLRTMGDSSPQRAGSFSISTRRNRSDQELAHLIKDLELTPEQQQQVRPLLEEHQDRIQALLAKNPTASRQELGPQIHTISDETHRKIHALLTDQQSELEKAMQHRQHNGGENRRSAPPTAASPEPSFSAR